MMYAIWALFLTLLVCKLALDAVSWWVVCLPLVPILVIFIARVVHEYKMQTDDEYKRNYYLQQLKRMR